MTISAVTCSYFNNCPAISVPGMMHPVQVYYLEDLPNLMGQYSFIVPKFSKPRIADDEEVDVDLVANVISWIIEAFAKTDGAVLCFLPVRPDTYYFSANIIRTSCFLAF